jgi:hypothetical protein
LIEKIEYSLKILKKSFEGYTIKIQSEKNKLHFIKGDTRISFIISGESFKIPHQNNEMILPVDLLISQPEKIAGIVLSKLKLNKTVFARKVEVKKTDKKTATEFLDKYHLMNSTQSAYNLGLYSDNELITLASFSKGRKMNRLTEDKRSFELIRFCCKTGITVTGGLTKLLSSFCEQKNAGDIMTYVDKQLSDGRSFIKAGFKKHGETPPNYYLVNKETFKRAYASKDAVFDPKKYYLTSNTGNIKLVYTPNIQK